ncbi:MAG: methylmalonyl-CoA mutase family protein [Deltaproteobacteria bacterium]|nr:methylmalonyl-CoA mutase family protein [Deltaproteobacteria bacterium]
MAENKNLDQIRQGIARYDAGVEKSLARAKELVPEFLSLSDVPIRRLYTPADVPEFEYGKDLGFPGEYPFTRGVQNTMYRGRLWTMRQFSGFGTAEETNERYKYLLRNGQTGLSVAFHYPTLKGVNSDHPLARGEVGKCGVAIDSLRDMEILFDGIPLGEVTTSMTVNHPAPALLAMYLTVAEKQGVTWDQVGGTVQNDPLKEFFAQKSFIWPPKESVKLLVDTMEFCAKSVPKWHPVSISGYHIREAGSTAQQELAFTLADGIAYVQAAVERGLDVDHFAPHLSFFFDAHVDFFEEIAKFRAARRLWAKIMKERFGAKDPKSLWLRFHTQTAGCSLAAQQPLNNIARTGFQALSAILGGTQSLHTNSFDEAEALPTEEAVTVALRTQQILAHETGVANTIDPLAGSYFVEAFTDEMQRAAEEYIRKIDDLGGMVAAVEAGYPQSEIIRASMDYQRGVEKGDKVIVGVNKFVTEEAHGLKLLKIDNSAEKNQLRRILETKQNRDNARVEKTLDRIRDVARSGDNLLPPILEAVREYALLGEICGAIVDVFGAYQDPAIF